MKPFKQLLAIAALAGTLVSCNKTFENMYPNPNKPTGVPASLLLNGILNNMLDAPGGQSDRTNQFQAMNNSYFGTNTYVFGSGDNMYATLNNVVQMETQAISGGGGSLNPYAALGKFFRAYFFAKMSLEMGDIPMSQALNGQTTLTPKYDAQKDIFKQAFVWLDSANSELGQLIQQNNLTLTGDFYFNNSLAEWQKVVNAYRLRLLIHLSKKATSDADLNIPGQFATILNNPAQYPLLSSIADDLKYTWLYPTNQYPLNKGLFSNAVLSNSTSTYVGLLTTMQDPRLFVTTDPAPSLVTGGKQPNDFAAFQGADVGADMGVLASENGGGSLSYINRWRYYSGYTGEPTTIVGYVEMCYNIAEAINRGWVSAGAKGDAESYYTAGIQASWSYYSVPLSGSMTAYSLPLGVPVTGPYVSTTVNTSYADFYAQASVKYAGNNADGLAQILKQKYIAFYENGGLEAYFNWRRTGVPTFSTGVGTGNNSKIALRYKYLAGEQSANTANYNAAIAAYNNVDDINGIMWLLQ